MKSARRATDSDRLSRLHVGTTRIAIMLKLGVQNQCNSLPELAFSRVVTAGPRLARSGVRCEIARFGEDEPNAAARGHFMHLCIDRATRRPVPVAADLRLARERISR